MSFGGCVAPALLSECMKIDEGISCGLRGAVRGVHRLPIEAIIDDGSSAGAIAAIYANARLGGIECIARIQGGTVWLSALPSGGSAYGSGRRFSAKSPCGNDSAGMAAHRCKRCGGDGQNAECASISSIRSR